MTIDADPDAILDDIYRARPWAFRRVSVYNRMRFDTKPLAREDEPSGSVLSILSACVGAAFLFIVVGGMASVVFADFSGREVEDLWLLPRVLAYLFPPVLAVALVLLLLGSAIDIGTHWLKIWSIRDTQVISARRDRFEYLATDLRSRFTAAALERTKEALEIEQGQGTAHRASLESAGAIVAAVFAAVEALLGERGPWLPAAAALVALALALQARRSRLKAERVRVAALVLQMATEPAQP